MAGRLEMRHVSEAARPPRVAQSTSLTYIDLLVRSRKQAVLDKLHNGCGWAQLPPARSTIWAMVMLQFMCYRGIWTVTFACAALVVMCG